MQTSHFSLRTLFRIFTTPVLPISRSFRAAALCHVVGKPTGRKFHVVNTYLIAYNKSRIQKEHGGGKTLPEKIHDMGYKRILSQKKYFVGFLHDFIREDWAKEIREEDVELIDKEFILKDFKDKESDIIYRVRIGNRIVVFYFLLELQSKVDFTIPFRLLNYILGLYNRLFQDAGEKEREKKNYRLPVVVPCILYNGTGNWTAARSFREYLQGGDLFGEYAIDFRYILLDINRLTDEDLFAVGSIVSSVFVLDKKRKPEAFLASLMQVLRKTKKLPDGERTELIHWMADVLSKKDETYKELTMQALEWMEKGDVEDMTYAIERMLDKIEKDARKEGQELGWKQGQELGWKQGQELGWKQGQHYGESVKTIRALRKAFSKGQSIYMVSDLLDLSHDQANQIVDAIQKEPDLSDSELAARLQNDSEFRHCSDSDTSA
jgi:predicted transposase/invertase (TIGR01784 family)